MKFLVSLLVVLFLLLQYKLWFGESGVQQVWRYEKRIEVLREELHALKDRNGALQAEVDDLRNGLAVVEERARRDLGMIKKNETFFQIIEPATK